jgi:hypothetical protein
MLARETTAVGEQRQTLVVRTRRRLTTSVRRAANERYALRGMNAGLKTRLTEVTFAHYTTSGSDA